MNNCWLDLLEFYQVSIERIGSQESFQEDYCWGYGNVVQTILRNMVKPDLCLITTKGNKTKMIYTISGMWCILFYIILRAKKKLIKQYHSMIVLLFLDRCVSYSDLVRNLWLESALLHRRLHHTNRIIRKIGDTGNQYFTADLNTAASWLLLTFNVEQLAIARLIKKLGHFYSRQ